MVLTRIIGGVHGGRRIKTPPGEGTRPTSDRVREALFSALEARFGTLHGLAVLDLYAGSGAIALEAASRGARRSVAVESDRRSAAVVADNARALGSAVEVVAQPVASWLAAPAPAPFDIVFLDPPYPLAEEALAADLRLLVEGGWLADGAVVVVERSRRSVEPTWPAGLGDTKHRKYGETVLWYVSADSGEQA